MKTTQLFTIGIHDSRKIIIPICYYIRLHYIPVMSQDAIALNESSFFGLLENLA